MRQALFSNNFTIAYIDPKGVKDPRISEVLNDTIDHVSTIRYTEKQNTEFLTLRFLDTDDGESSSALHGLLGLKNFMLEITRLDTSAKPVRKTLLTNVNIVSIDDGDMQVGINNPTYMEVQCTYVGASALPVTIPSATI